MRKKGSPYSRKRRNKGERIGKHEPVSRIISGHRGNVRKYKCLACGMSGAEGALLRVACDKAKNPTPEDMAAPPKTS